jgi:tRNA-splicing ligase RtcB
MITDHRSNRSKAVQYKNINIEKIHDNLYEIPAFGNMRVPGRIYASSSMLKTIVAEDESIQQVINVAQLPGIQKYSLGMPDIHWGYGFPIGGVAATDLNEGVISPGGVGYDINCGVRLARTSLTRDDIKAQVPILVSNLFKNIPTGVGSEGAIRKLNEKEMIRVLKNGAHWAVEEGYGKPDDIIYTEESGKLQWADPQAVSKRAIERGRTQVGTLGSGNHFLEVDVVDHIFLPHEAQILDLFENQIVILIHTGSRGCGYQVCDDFLRILGPATQKYGFTIPDRQLACAPIQSQEGQDYMGAMAAAANFAWANRQVIMSLAHETLQKTFSISPRDLGFELIYDVCHNIAKIEEHDVAGERKKVCLHRKGATRAFPPNSPEIPEKYQEIGQPVLVPGDMGRYSFVCLGTAAAMQQTFGSTCHGAGRLQSRKKAKKLARGRDLFAEMTKMGVEIRAKGRGTVAEEMPYAYKDVATVVDVMDQAGISRKVARLKPIGVIKG